jgi:hypothetical protein
MSHFTEHSFSGVCYSIVHDHEKQMKILVTTAPPDGNNKCHLKALLSLENLTIESYSLLSRYLYII